MKRILIIIMLLLLTGCKVDEEIDLNNNYNNPYTNPVFKPVMADPTIIKAEDGYYYVYGTEDYWSEESGAHVVAIIRSKNLVDWEFVGDAFEEKPDWNGLANIWAPDIQYFNDTYYLYYSLSIWDDPNPGIGVATSSSPEGPFIDHGKLFDSDEIGVENSIDPFIYITEDNDKWMFWGSFHGIYAIELSEDGLSTVGEKVHIGGNAFEGAYIVKKDEYYYLFASRGTCCNGADSTYNVRVGRSKDLLGPYFGKLGINIKYGLGSKVIDEGTQFVGVGHNSVIIDDNGDYWLIYHGIDKDDPYVDNGGPRRPLMIDKIIWSKNGWPKIENFRASEVETEGPYFNNDQNE